MRFTKPFLLSGLFAAAIVGGLVLYGLYGVNRPPRYVRYVKPNPEVPPPSLQPGPQPSPPVPEPPVGAAKTYRNGQLAFAVDYPDPILPTEDRQDMAMSGYFPICEPDDAVVCFPYGKEALPGRNFDGAAFSIHARTDLKTQKSCEAAGNGEQEAGTATVGSLTFKKFSYGDAAMGHQLSGENERIFRNAACLQLSTRIATTTFENYEPGSIRRFTDEERAAVLKILDGMRASFRFTSR